jgi:hypothetical protein
MLESSQVIFRLPNAVSFVNEGSQLSTRTLGGVRGMSFLAGLLWQMLVVEAEKTGDDTAWVF